MLLSEPFIFRSSDALIPFAKLRAQAGIYTGTTSAANTKLMRYCSHQLVLKPDYRAHLIYTRDSGHHSSGWWRNPDYERCLHLSLSFAGGYHGEQAVPFDRVEAEKIARTFFGEHTPWCWVEKPYTPEGKARDVWHYRLFCNPAWQPIQPKGEVYSRENTPAEWQSFSEIHGYKPDREKAPFLLDVSE